MGNFIEVGQELIQNIIIPSVAVIMSYFGWKANSERNKLKAEIEGMKAHNTEQEIKNQSSWIDLYEKLANNQAGRMAQMEDEIQQLKTTIKHFENAFKKAHTCNYYDVCPIRLELSKLENGTRKRSVPKRKGNGQRKRTNNIRDPVADDSPDESEPEPEL